jgi:hypothetical protein
VALVVSGAEDPPTNPATEDRTQRFSVSKEQYCEFQVVRTQAVLRNIDFCIIVIVE